MNDDIRSFAVGVATGAALIGVSAYIAAPAIAERAVVRAVKEQGQRLFGVTGSFVDTLATQLGILTREQVRAAILP